MAIAMKAADHAITSQHKEQNHVKQLIETGTTHEQRIGQAEETHDQSLEFRTEENQLKLKLMKQEAAIRKTEQKSDSNNSDSK